jgi:phenylalanyl-tRNA synthetase beta chain
MPKIEVNAKNLYALSGRAFSRSELEQALPAAKAELDGVDEAAGTLKIELNDTNRPDLWSTAGLARQLRTMRTGERSVYPFFSSANAPKPAGYRVIVEKSVQAVRPFIAGFVARGVTVSDASLKDMIQTQEKLAWNYGRRRRTVSIGLYRTAIIKWPVVYKAEDPDAVSFVPLQETRRMSLRQILREHPKGREYAFILENEALHPLLVDSTGAVLSYPPIINSADLGAVQVGDSELFIEVTGGDMPSVNLAVNIMACDLADQGFEILPVGIEYPYATPFGRSVVTPFYFQKPQEVEAGFAARLLGDVISPGQAASFVARMGCQVEVEGATLKVRPPEYRNDFLHPVDIVEDIMIGRGMDSFEPVMPGDFTVGRLSDMELYSRSVNRLMVGLGFQEMIFNYLGSGRDFAERMGVSDSGMVRISNPMSENFEYVRDSILPQLLAAESVSGNAVYPHHIFEIGKTARLDPAQNYGTRTDNRLGFLSAAAEAGYNQVNSVVSALLYYLNVGFSLEDADDPRFIPGRAALLKAGGRTAGIFGEIHPQVLENWGIGVPCTAGELDLDLLSSAV